MEPCLPPFLDREETLETEPVAGNARTDQGRDESRRSRKSLHFYAFTGACAYQQETRV